MADKAKLSTKFQIVIPKWIREAQDWRSGQEFVLLPKGKGVLVMPVPDRDDLLGLAEGARPVSYRDRSDRI